MKTQVNVLLTLISVNLQILLNWLFTSPNLHLVKSYSKRSSFALMMFLLPLIGSSQIIQEVGSENYNQFNVEIDEFNKVIFREGRIELFTKKYRSEDFSFLVFMDASEATPTQGPIITEQRNRVATREFQEATGIESLRVYELNSISYESMYENITMQVFHEDNNLSMVLNADQISDFSRFKLQSLNARTEVLNNEIIISNNISQWKLKCDDATLSLNRDGHITFSDLDKNQLIFTLINISQ